MIRRLLGPLRFAGTRCAITNDQPVPAVPDSTWGVSMPEIRIYDPPNEAPPSVRWGWFWRTDVTLIERHWLPGTTPIQPLGARHEDRLTGGRFLVDGTLGDHRYFTLEASSSAMCASAPGPPAQGAYLWTKNNDPAKSTEADRGLRAMTR